MSKLEPKYLDDEKVAKKLILAEETRVMKNLQNIFGYVNTKLKQEFLHLMGWMSKGLTWGIGEFAQRFNGLSDVVFFWDYKINVEGR